MTTKTPNGTPIFHADHGLAEAHHNLIDAFMTAKTGFFIEAIPLEELSGTLQSALYGPSCGDEPIGEEEVEYVKRGNRPGPSRLIDKPTRPADHMVIIGIAGDDAKVFTAYGSIGANIAPREWWDSSMRPEEAEAAARFWKVHALAVEVIQLLPRRVFEYKDFGSTIEFAEELGWVDTHGDGRDDDYDADSVEEDAIIFIKNAGYRVENYS